mgnify:CR=1 FL=1
MLSAPCLHAFPVGKSLRTALYRPGALETTAVPLKLNSDINEILKKNTVAQIYEAVIADINEAEKLINKESWEHEIFLSFQQPYL